VLGSLLGTFLDSPRARGLWDGALILRFVLVAELRTRREYTSSSWLVRRFSFGKKGRLFAILVDAFKVGS
jgi:hypothetical protein